MTLPAQPPASTFRHNRLMQERMARRKRRAERTNKTGIIAAIIKIIAKLTAPILKFIKAGKIVLAAASAAAYSLIFTWQFALVILGMLVVHEYGHLVMMKRARMKTKGIYLIPFLGAAAVADSAFTDRRSEAVIALAGPITGFALSLLCALAYFVTGWPFLAAVAAWGALINLFNLLPVSPLDGGRVAKSLFFSFGSRVGVTAMALALCAGAWLGWTYKLYIFAVILPLGLLDLFYERRRENRKAHHIPRLTKAQTVQFFGLYFALASALLIVMSLMNSEPGAAAALKAMQG